MINAAVEFYAINKKMRPPLPNGVTKKTELPVSYCLTLHGSGTYRVVKQSF